MPTARWTERERRTGFILQAVLGLNDQEVFDLMGRIFGEEWRAQVSRNERKKYLLKDIRDEIKWRWSAGKRQAQWNTIDPEGGPSPAERSNWLQTLAEIRTAAGDTSLPNFLLEDLNGNLTRPLGVIRIPPVLPAYRRDPNTFDDVFFEGRRRPAGRAAGPSTQPSTQASSSRTTASSTRTNAPSTRTSTPPARTSTLPTRTKAKTKSPAKKKTLAKQSTTTAAPQPAAAPTPADNPGWFLPMIHRTWLINEQAAQLQVRPQWLLADSRAKHIYEESPVRLYSGQIIRLYNPLKNGRFDDFLVCQDQVCAWCTGTAVIDDACDAELVAGVDVAQSPTQGLPFVHMGRDVAMSNLRGGSERFHPAPGFHEMGLPARTRTATIDCMTEGSFRNRAWRAVNVLGCVKEECGVCTPGVGVETAVTVEPEGPTAADEEEPQEENEWGDTTDSEDSKESDYERGPTKRLRRGDRPRKGRGGGRGGRGGGRGGRGGRGGKGGAAGRATARKPGTVVAGPD